MLGRWSSVVPLVEVIGKENVENILVTPLVQGRTTRWAITWSFQPYRIKTTNLHSEHYCCSKYLPLVRGRITRPIEYFIYRPYYHLKNEDEARKNLTDYLDKFAIPWVKKGEDEFKIIVLASLKSWSREARRKREKNGNKQPSSNDKDHGIDLLLAVDLVISANSISPTWLYGRDVALFDSFVSVLEDWVKQLPTHQAPPQN